MLIFIKAVIMTCIILYAIVSLSADMWQERLIYSLDFLILLFMLCRLSGIKIF
jgi:hypothetical protein